VHPSRQADCLADVLGAQRGAVVGTIGVHRRLFSFGGLWR
jgi:hypothetical protein